MPYKSKAQMRKFFAMEAKGELPKGKAREWAHHTPDIKDLPEKKAMSETDIEKVAAWKVGWTRRMADAGVLPSTVIDVLQKKADGLLDIGKSAIGGIAGSIPTAAKVIGAGALAAPLAIGGAAGAAEGYLNAPTSDDLKILQQAEMLAAYKRHTDEIRARMAQRQGVR